VQLVKAVQQLKIGDGARDPTIAKPKSDNDNLRTELRTANDNEANDSKAINELHRETGARSTTLPPARAFRSFGSARSFAPDARCF
jgi:hypothetical protein